MAKCYPDGMLKPPHRTRDLSPRTRYHPQRLGRGPVYRARDLSLLARLQPTFITHRTRDTMIHHGWRGHAMML